VNDEDSFASLDAITGANGAALLDDVHAFLSRFVAYPSVHAGVAHTLWVGHTHLMAAWDSTPRIAFLSPEPNSGKTRALEVSELLVPNPVEAVNVTPAYLFRKVGAGTPTILYDEVDTVFGPKAKDNEEIRGLLNAGHRRGAVAGRCVVKGKVVETEEIPAYSAVALAGLGGLPDTLLSRSVVIRMRRRAPSERVDQFRRREHGAAGHDLRDRVAAWADAIRDKVTGAWPDMPTGVEDRDADVWEALLAVADAAGGHWPQQARVAAVALVAESKASTPSLGVLLLTHLRDVFGDDDALPTETILNRLHALDEAPWADLRGKALNARGLAARLHGYGVHPKTIRVGHSTPRGYTREDLHDPWCRYLGPPPVDPQQAQQAQRVQRQDLAEPTEPPEPTGEPSISDENPACSVCSADLWAPQSRGLGICARCAATSATPAEPVADVADVAHPREASPDASRGGAGHEAEKPKTRPPRQREVGDQ
jgi:hypothetical protein